MRKFVLLCCLIVMALIVSCESDTPSTGSSDCSISEQNSIVYDILKDSYLWYEHVPDVDPATYSSPSQLLEELKYSFRDKWSHISTKKEYNQYYEEGRYQGMGFSAAFDNSGRLWIEFVFKDSPADKKGIKRSDEILKINDRAVSLFADLNAVWDEIYRYETADIELRTASIPDLHYDWVTINTVLHSEIILEITGKAVGYLVFTGFIEPSVNELDTVFSHFKDENVNELILDLRYNGGGRLSVAKHLAGLISGSDTNDQVFVQILHNNKYSRYNDAMYFTSQSPANALGLERVFIISTENTCSASEIMINSLEPYMEVFVIGDATCGKPVGMYPHEFCDSVLLPIEFKTANALGNTDYFNGLQPDCGSIDDLTHDFGDLEEDSLKTALNYIENGPCTGQTGAARIMKSKKLQQMNQRKGLRREIRAF